MLEGRNRVELGRHESANERQGHSVPDCRTAPLKPKPSLNGPPAEAIAAGATHIVVRRQIKGAVDPAGAGDSGGDG